MKMTIRCSNCGFENTEGANFCMNCGTPILNNQNSSALQSDLEWFADKLYNGEISLPTSECPILLKKREEPIIVLPNVIFKEPRSVRTSVGGFAGPTIHITKGVSFRLGGASSRSISHEEIKTIDHGILTITNKRLAFTGPIKTLNYNLNKIIAINDFEDGIAIQRDNKQKTEYFLGTNQTIINYHRGSQQKSTPFYGSLIKTAIMGQLE